MNAPQAASAISTAIRGSALPAVATPSAMIADSLGTRGIRASSAGRAAAITYDAGDEMSSVVRPIKCVLRCSGQRAPDQHGRNREWSMRPPWCSPLPSVASSAGTSHPRKRGGMQIRPWPRGGYVEMPAGGLTGPGRGPGFDAELVALRVLHDRVARVMPHHAGAQRLQPGHLGRLRAGGTQVEVHPVLGRLGLADPDEPDVRPAPARRLDERLVSGRVLIHVRTEDGRPEPGQRQRVRGVERDGLDHARHALHGSRGAPGRSLSFDCRAASLTGGAELTAAWTA